MTQPPPSRFRVVERGRRLVVIDSWADGRRPGPTRNPPGDSGERPPPVAEHTPRTAAGHTPGQLSDQSTGQRSGEPGAIATTSGMIARTSFDGRATITTHRAFDDKGPRTISLDPDSASLVKLAQFSPFALAIGVVVVILISPWLLLPLGFVAVQGFPKIRAAITRWLDSIERNAD